MSPIVFAMGNTEIINCHSGNMTMPFDYLVHKDGVKTFHFDGTDSFIDMDTCF